MITEEQLDSIVQPGLTKVFVNAFNELPNESIVGAMYNMVNSDKRDEDYLEMEELGNMPVFTGEVNYQEFREGNAKTVAHTEFAMGVKIQRRLFDDDLYGVIEKMIRSMGYVARYRMEQDGAGPFINAFNSTYTTFDGLSLCNSSHSFVSTSTIQSNTGTTAWSYAALDAATITMRKYTDSQDRSIFSMSPDLVLGPVDLESQFIEVLESRLKPGTANNNTNAYYRQMKWMTHQLLNDTNNWFLIDTKKMKEWLIWQQRIPLEFANVGDFDSYGKKYKSYMRYSNTPLHWIWVFGSNVS